MEDILVSLLSSFGFPVIRQGSLAPDEAYPDTFFTFWNSSEDGELFYDNECYTAVFDFAVNVYSNAPATAYETIAAARKLLRKNNWIIVTRAYDVASDEITHIGRGMRVQYMQTNLSESEPE